MHLTSEKILLRFKSFAGNNYANKLMYVMLLTLIVHQMTSLFVTMLLLIPPDDLHSAFIHLKCFRDISFPFPAKGSLKSLKNSLK